LRRFPPFCKRVLDRTNLQPSDTPLVDILHQLGLTDWNVLWTGLLGPLLRLVFFIAVGLMVGNLIEALNWTHGVARIAAPLVRLGHLRDVAGASFSMAFFSTVTANTMLAGSYEKGEMSRRELVFANLFNSTPSFFLHLPTMFFMAVPFIGQAAVTYVGLVLAAAVLRTLGTVVMGRIMLPPLPEGCITCILENERSKGWGDALRKSWKRFLRRMPRIVYITVPVYVLVYVMTRTGGFDVVRDFMTEHVTVLAFLNPEGLSVVILHLAAEFTAALSAAGMLLQSGALSPRDVVLTLLVGNILSSPMRAFRHQFPSYAGIFKPGLALFLIGINQALRAASIACMAVLYFWWTRSV